MKVRRALLKDRVTATTYTGDSSSGPAYGPPVRGMPCHLDGTRRLVRDANGDETVSEVTLTLHPATRTATGALVDPLEVFTPETQVEHRAGTSRVIDAKPITRRGRTYAVEVRCT